MSDITTTIYNQFGGNRAMAMIGGKPSSMNASTLVVKFAAKATNKAAMISIRLDPSDTYTMTFYTRRGTVIRELADLYSEQLALAFEHNTGLYLSL